MKKVITILMILALCLALVCVASAEEMEKSGQPSVVGGQETEGVENSNEELRAYIEEKIVPILMGVATSIIALLGTLKGVFNALKGLRESKEIFDKEQAKIKESSKRELLEIKKKYDEIKTAIEGVPLINEQIKELRDQAAVLSQEIAGLSKITSLGFSKESELVREGKARKIVRLAEKNEELISNEAI